MPIKQNMVRLNTIRGPALKHFESPGIPNSEVTAVTSLLGMPGDSKCLSAGPRMVLSLTMFCLIGMGDFGLRMAEFAEVRWIKSLILRLCNPS